MKNLILPTGHNPIKPMPKHCYQPPKPKKTKNAEKPKRLTSVREYRMWQRMRQYCHNPNHKGFPNHGGIGIKICNKWKIYPNFLADMGACPKGSSLRLINPQKRYEPGNCKWGDYERYKRPRKRTK